MNQYLFLLTISPVQTFIEQARKAQDLFAGSRILSLLCWQGIKIIGNENVIFPNIKKEKADELTLNKNSFDLSLPNRFIAQIPSTDNLREVGKNIEKAIRDKWLKLADETLKLQKLSEPKGFNQQISQLLDIHWAFEEIKENDYKTAYSNLEALVGSIKNVRTFEQYSYAGIGEQGRKCSLDGERNALFYRKTERGQKPSFIENGTLVHGNQLNPGEGLSAVSFVKRFYYAPAHDPAHDLSRGLYKDSFPSTAKIALMNSLSKVDSSEFQKVFGRDNLLYQAEKEGCIKINGKDWVEWDEQFYYEENLISKQIPCEAQLEIAKKEHKILKGKFKEAGVPFTKYYALIIFDGDNMGKWLSGSKLKENTNLKEFHTTFSRLLAKFADEAKEIVSKPQGATIYAGGDDFLGMVNVHDLFDVMKVLRKNFDTTINQNTELQAFKKEGENFTFSAGIVIAHYKMPLAEVLKTARKTEKKAKNDGNRNAFAITAMKHSGEIQETVMRWGNDADTVKHWQILDEIVKNLKKEGDREANFSSKFIQSLTVELMQLGGLEKDDFSGFDNIVKAEIDRLVDRAKNKKQVSDSDVKTMQKNVFALWKAQKIGSLEVKPVQNFIHALQVADFLTRKTTQDQ